MIRCIIVDDEQHAIDLLTSHISKMPELELQFSTRKPIEAFRYLQANTPDLVFLDIQMPELSGLQLMKLADPATKIILTTAHPEHALEGYEHDIVDYLLKPILFERFLKAVQKAGRMITGPASPAGTEQKAGTDEGFLFIKTETRNKLVKLRLKDIEYIKSMGNYVSIHVPGNKLVTLSTLHELAEKLPAGDFVRIHHSYLVPVHKIVAVEGNQVQIGNQQLPVGESYKKDFLQLISKHILNGKKMTGPLIPCSKTHGTTDRDNKPTHSSHT